MLKNFTIQAFAEVIVADTTIDLHNLYGVASIRTDLAGDVVTLTFQRDRQWSGPDTLPEAVTLTCSGNLKMAFNDLVGALAPLRDDAVEVAYYDADCEWDTFLDEELAASQGFEGLQINFSAGLVLRIRADLAEVAI
ncbi:hypothetical protein [Altererythrobacter sp.]|uniref:hypothetical protein n=1 Tax=Altererythrobacter sp. TaxID=1872480 RepID=UPI003D09835E